MGSPLKVLHVVVNMNRGGAETLIMNLYRNIDRSKVQFDFLTCKQGVFDSEIRKLGGEIHRIPYVSDIGHSGFSRELQHFFETHREYKIVHSHLDKMSGIVIMAAKRAGVPIRIAHSHNTESEGGLLTKMYKWYAGSRIHLQATHYYACSEAAADWMFRGESDKAYILKNGIELDRFQFSQATRDFIRKEMQINKETLVLGHVGRFLHQKNHLFLLDIFAELNKQMPNSLLLLVGDGPLKTAIREKIKALHVAEKVKLLGVRSDINALLHAMDLFVFPSFHEGLPVTLVEAQGAGLPCFISDRITKEVDLGAGLIEHIPLTGTNDWVQQIIQSKKQIRSRNVDHDVFSRKGYDIRNTVKEMQSTYLSMGEKAI